MTTEERMRFTLIDATTTVSFVGRASAAAALVAACAEDPIVLDDLLENAGHIDRTLPNLVRHGMAIFDEHNIPGDHAAIDRHIQTQRGEDLPLFRVVDEVTRRTSLEAVGAGLIIFNLPQRRIIQVANTYDPVQRSGAVNYHNGQFLSQRTFHYALPNTWSIVP